MAQIVTECEFWSTKLDQNKSTGQKARRRSRKSFFREKRYRRFHFFVTDGHDSLQIREDAANPPGSRPSTIPTPVALADSGSIRLRPPSCGFGQALFSSPFFRHFVPPTLRQIRTFSLLQQVVASCNIAVLLRRTLSPSPTFLLPRRNRSL